MPQSSARRRTRWASSVGLDLAEAGGRLVEQQDARLRRDRARDREQPPLAVGEVLDDAVEVVLEMELLDRADDLGRQRRVDRPDEVARRRSRSPAGRSPRAGSSNTVESSNSSSDWNERPDAGARRASPATSREMSSPSSSSVPSASGEARDRVDQRGLAGAVRADQPETWPGVTVSGDALDRDGAAVPHGQVADLERALGHRVSSSTRRGQRHRLRRPRRAGTGSLPASFERAQPTWAIHSLAMPSWLRRTSRIRRCRRSAAMYLPMPSPIESKTCPLSAPGRACRRSIGPNR